MKKKGAANSFRTALELGGFDVKTEGRCHVQSLDAEDDLRAVRECLQHAYGLSPTGDWIANLSGGTKPMSIAAYEFFKALGGRLVYVNFSKPNLLLGLDGHPAEICSYRPTIREFLAGYGFEFRKNEGEITAAEERARRWWESARLIAVRCPEQPLLCFGDLTNAEVKKRWDSARKHGHELESGQLSPNDVELQNALAASFELQAGAGGSHGKLDKYAVGFLTGGWLEVFLWGLLDHHATTLNIWDVRLGIHPAKIGVDTDNDFDVSFMKDYRLCMAECKSGSQEHDPGAEILHKVEAVVRQFRALGIRSYLATTSPNVQSKAGGLRPGIRDRAAIYECRILVRHQIQHLAQSSDDSDVVRQVMFATNEA